MTEKDNMKIWKQVCDTNPDHTKLVDFGRKFTSIDAYSQIQRATEVFGAVGKGWGWDSDLLFTADGLVVCKLKLWYMLPVGQKTIKDKEVSIVQHYKTGEIYGCCKASFKDKVDDDAPKKALTDAITKGLSYLGFNADVFLGKFDDNKYIEKQTEKYNADILIKKWYCSIDKISTKDEITIAYQKVKPELDNFANHDTYKPIYDKFYEKACEFGVGDIMESENA